ncbi:hypothetical protein D3C87_529120 [compost metagenome]
MGKNQFEEIKALFGNSDTYYLIRVDMAANYAYVNKHYDDAFRHIHGNLVGEHYAITMHEDDVEICNAVANLAFNNRNDVFPATIRKHDGRGGYIITRWDYKALFDENDNPLGIFCIGHDITELTKIAGELDQIKTDHSHSVRSHVANLMGLGKLIQEANGVGDIKAAAKMILQSTNALDQAIRTVYQNNQNQ